MTKRNGSQALDVAGYDWAHLQFQYLVWKGRIATVKAKLVYIRRPRATYTEQYRVSQPIDFGWEILREKKMKVIELKISGNQLKKLREKNHPPSQKWRRQNMKDWS